MVGAVRADAAPRQRSSNDWFRGLLALSFAPAIVVFAAPGFGFATAAGDIVLDTVGTAAALLGTVAAAVRAHARPSRAAHLLVVAFAFRTTCLAALVSAPAVAGISTGASVRSATAASAVVGAALLVLAAFTRPSHAPTNTSTRRLLALGGGMALAVGMCGAALPPGRFHVMQAATAVLYGGAAAGFALRARRVPGPRFMWWLSASLALGAWSKVDGLLVASDSPSAVSLAELLRGAGAVALAVGAVGELRREWRAARERAIHEERKRLAGELHDGLAQELAYIVGQSRMLARAFPHEQGLAHIGAAAEHALHESRSAIHDLQASRSPCLSASVEARAHELADRWGLKLEVDVEEDIDSSPEMEHAVLSVLQEAISNSARHAEATQLGVSLTSRGHSLALRVSDDGRGFHSSSAAHGFGLRSMQRRAADLRGELQVESRPGGTTIELAIPIGAHDGGPSVGARCGNRARLPRLPAGKALLPWMGDRSHLGWGRGALGANLTALHKQRLADGETFTRK